MAAWRPTGGAAPAMDAGEVVMAKVVSKPTGCGCNSGGARFIGKGTNGGSLWQSNLTSCTSGNWSILIRAQLPLKGQSECAFRVDGSICTQQVGIDRASPLTVRPWSLSPM